MALALAGLVALASGVLARPTLADAAQHQLTVTKSGTGSGTVTSAPVGIDCGATCQASFDDGTDVILTAVSAHGSWTVLWSGCDGLTAEYQCVVEMTAAKEVFASFGSSGPPPQPADHQLLTITRGGTGGGTVTSAPAGIECGSGATCQASFDDGTDVILTAVSAPGSWTVLWSGCDGLPLANQCFVYMNAPREVFAWFGGSIAADPVDPDPDPDPGWDIAPLPGPGPEDEARSGKAEEHATPQRALAKKRARARAKCRKLQGKAEARCKKRANLIGRVSGA